MVKHMSADKSLENKTLNAPVSCLPCGETPPP